MDSIGVEDRDMATGGTVRILRLTAPPVNALSHVLRAGLDAALTVAFGDATVRAIVITGAGRAFSTGLDPAVLGRAQDVPSVADLAQRIATAPKPVIAALHGLCLSAAAEMALAAHARVASRDLRMGLRGVLVGQLPDAGATQFLPRLVGAEAAIRLLRDARLVTAEAALALGMVDAVADDVLDAAVALSAQTPLGARNPGLRDARRFQADLVAARAGADAWGLRLIGCVEAAYLLPLEQGLAFEATAAAEVATGAEAAALLHAMRAELRLASAVPAHAPTQHLGLWGAGTVHLVLPALRAGLTVTFGDTDRTALVAALEQVALAQEAQVQAGLLTDAAREADWARLHPATTAPQADLVIAALPGAAGALHWGPATMDASGLVLGAHGLAEVQVRDSDQVLGGLVLATLRRIGLRAVVTRPAPASVMQTLLDAVQQALRAMVRQGVAGAALGAGMPAWLQVPMPQATGHVVVDPGEVEQKVMGALVAAGARMVATGQVRAPSDVDVVAMTGLQMPRKLGGPMYQADLRGLLIVRRDLALWARDDAVWMPAALFDDLIAKGKGFGSLNG